MYNVNAEKNYVINELMSRYEFNSFRAEDVFNRLARDVSVFRDFSHFLRTGELTNLDQEDSVLGHTVDELVSKYGLEPIGAYLMLSELAVDPMKAEEYLEKILVEGHEFVEKRDDGTIVRVRKGGTVSKEPEGFFPVCTKCGVETDWVEEYERWYCYECKEYLPEEKKEEQTYSCSTCNGELTWIEQYQRWYCYSCQTYAPS